MVERQEGTTSVHIEGEELNVKTRKCCVTENGVYICRSLTKLFDFP